MIPRLRQICDDIILAEKSQPHQIEIAMSCLTSDRLAESFGQSWNPTSTQEASLEKAKFHLEGGRIFRYKPRLKFPHVEVKQDQSGSFLTLDGKRLSVNVSKKEGPAIAQFISEAYDSIEAFFRGKIEYEEILKTKSKEEDPW